MLRAACGVGAFVGEWGAGSWSISIAPTGAVTVRNSSTVFDYHATDAVARDDGTIAFSVAHPADYRGEEWTLGLDEFGMLAGLAKRDRGDVRGVQLQRLVDGAPPPAPPPVVRSASSQAREQWAPFLGDWGDSKRDIRIEHGSVRWLGSTVFPNESMRVTDVHMSAEGVLTWTMTFPTGYAAWRCEKVEEGVRPELMHLGVHHEPRTLLITAANNHGHQAQVTLVRREVDSAKAQYFRPETMMMLMLVLSSGKRDFDLCVTRSNIRERAVSQRCIARGMPLQVHAHVLAAAPLLARGADGGPRRSARALPPVARHAAPSCVSCCSGPRCRRRGAPLARSAGAAVREGLRRESSPHSPGPARPE